MKVSLFESESTKRIPTFVAFTGGYFFGLYLVYVLFYSLEWDKYPILVIWIISSLMFPGLGMLLGNKPLWLPFLPILYGMYAVIAYKRFQLLGSRLFMAHYGLGVLLLGMLLFYAKADISDIFFVVVIFFKNPILLLYLTPFAFGNFWYLYRIRLKNRPINIDPSSAE